MTRGDLAAARFSERAPPSGIATDYPTAPTPTRGGKPAAVTRRTAGRNRKSASG